MTHRYFVLAPGSRMKYLGPRGYTAYEAWSELQPVDPGHRAGGLVTYPRQLPYATCRQYELLPVDPIERAHFEFEKDAEGMGFDPRRGEQQWSYGGRRLEEHYAELSDEELRAHPRDPLCFWALVLRGEAAPIPEVDEVAVERP